MKYPSLNNVEGILLIGVAGFVVYVGYKAYAKGASISQGVKETASSIGDAVSRTFNSGELAFQKARTSVMGASSAPASDQSDAETARLKRLENDINQSISLPEPDGNPMGDMSSLGGDSVYAAYPQDYSPTALGIA